MTAESESKDSYIPLPFCCDKIAKALAAAWNTSFEEECISMDSITALSIGNLSQRETNHCTGTTLQQLLHNCSSAY